MMWTQYVSKKVTLVFLACFGIALAQESNREPAGRIGDGVETMIVGDAGSTLLVGRFAGTLVLGNQRLQAGGPYDLYYMVYDDGGLLAAGSLGGNGADRFFGAHLNTYGEFVVQYAEAENGGLIAARLTLNQMGQVVDHGRAHTAVRISVAPMADGLQRRLALTPTYHADMPHNVLNQGPEKDEPAGITVLDPDPEPETNDPVGKTVLDPDPEPETNDPVGFTVLDPDPEPETNDPVGKTVLDPDPEPETNDPVGTP